MLLGGTSFALPDQGIPEVVFIPHFLRISEGGSFFGKTWREMNSQEFKTAVSVLCTVAMDCGGVDTVAMALVTNTQNVTSGGNYSTSGVVDRVVGEQWYLNVLPPHGYTTCSATYNGKTISANKGDTTNGMVLIHSGLDMFATYNVVPKNRPEGHWVGVDFLVKYVKNGTRQNHNCLNDMTLVWHVP